jgi:hypothetical protein
MNTDQTKHNFLAAAEAWVCDDYGIDIRYLALPSSKGLILHSALVGLIPSRPEQNVSFLVKTDRVVVGPLQKYPATKEHLFQILELAAEGYIEVDGVKLNLPVDPPHEYYSETGHRERPLSDLHLSVTGGQRSALSSDAVLAIDNALRGATPPFDGFPDLVSWLGLDSSSLEGGNCTLTLRVIAPTTIELTRSSLVNGELTLTLNTHPTFDLSQLRVAVRGAPGKGISTRRQVAKKVTWKMESDGMKRGHFRTALEASDSVLVMLMIGESVVQRYWFADPVKARNRRLLAVRHFDSELRKTRAAVLNPQSSEIFEKGVASLLFLLGFNPSLQIETDSPDIVVATPGGQLGIVECTTRIADFSTKLGKLVDRRAALSKAMEASGHAPDILAVLVCGLPRDQISAGEDELRDRRVRLIAKDDLVTALDYVLHPPDPDELVSKLRKELDT